MNKILFRVSPKILKGMYGLIALFLYGCFPSPVDFDPGWATRTISGTMLQENGEGLPEKPFIIVLEYFTRFLQFTDESPLYVPHARLLRPEQQGRFRIDFDLRASAIELVFVASGFRMQRFRFQRQMGVGELRYHARMSKSSGWEEHLLIEVAPFLENFILEPGYRMAEIHQQFLGDWLGRERESIGNDKNSGVMYRN